MSWEMPRQPSPHRQLHLLESPPRMIFDVETEEGLQEILGIFVSFFFVVGCFFDSVLEKKIRFLKGIDNLDTTYMPLSKYHVFMRTMLYDIYLNPNR